MTSCSAAASTRFCPDRAIGRGDLIDDYEGIGGHEKYRDDLRLIYLASIEPGSGELTALWMVPMRSRRLRLEAASPADSAWTASVLDRNCAGFGAGVKGVSSQAALGGVGALTLRW